jgi:GT2 family glycosyltransferase
MKISIVLTTWKRESITMTMLEALRKNTQTPYKLIIVDNGSEESYQCLYAKLADVYVKLEENKGLEYAKNIGMQFVDSELFVSTDNDILPYRYSPDWLSQLIDLMTKHPEYGAISLRPQILVGTGNIFQNHEEEDILEFTHVPGYLRIMRTDLVNKLGAWGDKRPLRGHEEYWISERMRDMGYKVGWAVNVKCWHYFGDQNWGYGDMKVEEHGHTPVSGLPKDDLLEIERKVGV